VKQQLIENEICMVKEINKKISNKMKSRTKKKYGR